MSEHEREIEQYKDFPYTMIGHSCLQTGFSIFLEGNGLKEIVKLMREDEDLRITITENGDKFEIVDTHDRYREEKVMK